MKLSIDIMTSTDANAWDAYVNAHPDGTFCHRAGWKTVIEQGAGQICPYLIAKCGTQIVGILPLTVKKHWIFGKALISNMFCVYGGPLAEDARISDALSLAAWDMAQKQNLPVLEYRTLKADNMPVSEWHVQAKSATFVRQLAHDDEQQLLDIPRKQRAVVRKSLNNRLTTDWNGTISTFYDLYARSVSGLGTPVFPKKLFMLLKHVFDEDVQVQITHNEHGNPVASLMSFYHGKTVMPYYAGAHEQARKLMAHDFMYYQLMCAARARGATHFDFGRSKIDSGPYKFKKNWGFEPTPLEYQWRLADGVSIPEMSQQSGFYGLMTSCWKKLPLAVSKVVGPIIARHLG